MKGSHFLSIITVEWYFSMYIFLCINAVSHTTIALNLLIKNLSAQWQMCLNQTRSAYFLFFTLKVIDIQSGLRLFLTEKQKTSLSGIFYFVKSFFEWQQYVSVCGCRGAVLGTGKWCIFQLYEGQFLFFF